MKSMDKSTKKVKTLSFILEKGTLVAWRNSSACPVGICVPVDERALEESFWEEKKLIPNDVTFSVWDLMQIKVKGARLELKKKGISVS